MIPALLLSGGKSRRLGFDKATVNIGTHSCIDIVAKAMFSAGLFPVVEVGHGFSDLKSIKEPTLGQGPLGAIVYGYDFFRHKGYEGPLMVVSCDLPYLNSAVLNLIIRASLSESVVPVSNGKKQPLCAKWSVHDLLRAKTKFLEGERSLKWFPSEDAVLLDSEFEFKECGGEENFKDIDTTDDFNQLIKDYEDGRFDFLGRDLYPPRHVNCGTDPIDLILEVNCSAGGPTS